jgi:UNC-50 family
VRRRFVGERFLKKKVQHHHTTEQSLEWLYAFDVHCNSFIPMFVLLYGAALAGTRVHCADLYIYFVYEKTDYLCT